MQSLFWIPDYQQHGAFRSLPFCHGSIHTYCLTGNTYFQRHNPFSILDCSSVTSSCWNQLFILPTWYSVSIFSAIVLSISCCSITTQLALPIPFFSASVYFAHEIILLETSLFSFYQQRELHVFDPTILPWCCYMYIILPNLPVVISFIRWFLLS